MCILLYVKLLWCSSIPYIYGQLEGVHLPSVYVHSAICYTYWCSGTPYIYGQLGDTSSLGICAFCFMWKLFGVVVFHRSMVNWRKEGLCICAFCSMWNFCGVAVLHRSMVNWRGYICPKYMCILLYVTHIWCSGIPYTYGQLEGGTSALSICAFCYMLNLFSVVVFCSSLVNWRRGTLVYVHSAICETFVV